MLSGPGRGDESAEWAKWRWGRGHGHGRGRGLLRAVVDRVDSNLPGPYRSDSDSSDSDSSDSDFFEAGPSGSEGQQGRPDHDLHQSADQARTWSGHEEEAHVARTVLCHARWVHLRTTASKRKRVPFESVNVTSVAAAWQRLQSRPRPVAPHAAQSAGCCCTLRTHRRAHRQPN